MVLLARVLLQVQVWRIPMAVPEYLVAVCRNVKQSGIESDVHAKQCGLKPDEGFILEQTPHISYTAGATRYKLYSQGGYLYCDI